MRSIDRYRKRHKEAIQSSKQESIIDWDFQVNENPPPRKSLPITLYDTGGSETEIERFERYTRQLTRCIHACSLCPNGRKIFCVNRLAKDPQFPQSIWYKEVFLIKWAPDENDINGLFNYDWLDINEFYGTSIMKCPNINGEFDCPYFDLEWQAIKQCMPKLIIIFDKKSAQKIGLNYNPKTFTKLGNTKVYFTTGKNDVKLKPLSRVINSPQARKCLFLS